MAVPPRLPTFGPTWGQLVHVSRAATSWVVGGGADAGLVAASLPAVDAAEGVVPVSGDVAGAVGAASSPGGAAVGTCVAAASAVVAGGAVPCEGHPAASRPAEQSDNHSHADTFTG